MEQSCEPKRILQNTAQATVDQANSALIQANADFLTCAGPKVAGEAALHTAQPTMNSITKEVETMKYIQNFVLQQLARESAVGSTVSMLAASAKEEETTLKQKIEDIRTEIRTEKRRFLDAQPSVSPSVGGLNYIMEPDNQVLIAFIVCFGLFVLLVGLIVIMDKIPGVSPITLNTGERVKIVVWSWVAILVLTVIYFFTYT